MVTLTFPFVNRIVDTLAFPVYTVWVRTCRNCKTRFMEKNFSNWFCSDKCATYQRVKRYRRLNPDSRKKKH